MIRFSLFGVPVSIHPSLWLSLAVLGGVLGATGAAYLLGVSLFVIACFFCLLCHEMGHALTGRYFGGGEPRVYLAWLGGDCNNPRVRLTRLQGVLMTAAGPLASLALGAVALLGLCLYVGCVHEALALALPFTLGQVPEGAMAARSVFALYFFLYLVKVCFWWSLVNIIPVFPLDGGMILHGLMSSPRRMHGISLAVACVLVLLFGIFDVWPMALFMLLLAVLNHNFRRNAPC